MVETLIAVFICGLAGYAIGRTFIQESLFDGWSEWIGSKTRRVDDFDNDIFVLDGKVMQRQESSPGEFELVLLFDTDLRNPFDGWKRTAFMPLSWLFAKLGDLFTCVWCLSAQSALQFYFWTFGFWAIVPITIPAMLAAAALTFLLNDYLNKHNDE